MTIFQMVHIVVVFFVSCESDFIVLALVLISHDLLCAVKLVKQVMHGTASGSLLAQSYLSTVLLFAGLYTLEYRFDVSH